MGITALVLTAPLAAADPANHAPYKPGFPTAGSPGGASCPTCVLVLPGEGTVAGNPLVADLGTLSGGTPGVKEIVFGTTLGKLHVLHRLASNGSWVEAPGFPVTVGNNIASSPAAGNLTDAAPCNSGLEIVVGWGASNTFGPGGVKAYCNTGALLWQKDSVDTLSPGTGPDPVVSTPAIGDIDGDGGNDVAWGGFDFYVHAVHGNNGAYLTGWPHFIRDSIWSSPALYDVNGDGRLDVIIGVDAHLEGPPYNTPAGGCLHVLPYNSSGDPPSEVAGFKQCIDQTIFSAPSVGDIDGDGQPEIVHGTGTFYPNGTERIYAWHLNGTPVSGWPVTIQGESPTSPALANLDGDAALEVIVTANNTRSSSTYHLYAFNGNGSAVPGFSGGKQVLDYFGVSFSADHPVVADVLGGTTAPEILVPTNGSAAVFDAAGNLLTEHNNGMNGLVHFYTETALRGVAVADFETDGQAIEVVGIDSQFGTNDLAVRVWNPVARSTPPLWGLFRHDEARRGVALTPIFSDGFESGNLNAWQGHT
ncbi:MAG TPA: VCBS repeat-containing protein [Thermoanaerobaculia bacterium]|nr:VCBS repeat-containing protein [Thermoanaerobaculia bacterium]